MTEEALATHRFSLFQDFSFSTTGTVDDTIEQPQLVSYLGTIIDSRSLYGYNSTLPPMFDTISDTADNTPHIPDITGHYDYGKVVISFVVSFFGAYLATSLCEQLRAHYLHGKDRNPWIPFRWFLLMGLSLGGIAVWAMHYIGMCAFSLYSDINHQPVPTYYNVPLSIGTFLTVFVLMTLGVVISSYDPLFMKTKGEILEMFIKDTSQLSMSEIRKIKNIKLFRIIATQSLHYLFIGGVIAAGGILIMHYIGMEALHFRGWWEYNPGQVVASVLIAIVAAVMAFWVLFRLLSLFPNKEFLRIICSFLMATAVCGTHYMGMHATIIQYSNNQQPPKPIEGYYVNRIDAYYPILVTSILAISFISMYLMMDLRSVVHRFYGKIDLRDEVLIVGGDLPSGLRRNSLMKSHGSNGNNGHGNGHGNHHHHRGGGTGGNGGYQMGQRMSSGLRKKGQTSSYNYSYHGNGSEENSTSTRGSTSSMFRHFFSKGNNNNTKSTSHSTTSLTVATLASHSTTLHGSHSQSTHFSHQYPTTAAGAGAVASAGASISSHNASFVVKKPTGNSARIAVTNTTTSMSMTSNGNGSNGNLISNTTATATATGTTNTTTRSLVTVASVDYRTHGEHIAGAPGVGGSVGGGGGGESYAHMHGMMMMTTAGDIEQGGVGDEEMGAQMVIEEGVLHVVSTGSSIDATNGRGGQIGVFGEEGVYDRDMSESLQCDVLTGQILPLDESSSASFDDYY